MTCPKCQHDHSKRFGTYGKSKTQRYRCRDCSATFSVRPPQPLGNHTTELDAVAQAFSMMLEGASVRAVSRLTGIHKNTLLRLLLTVGEKCQRVFDAKMQNIKPRHVQADELWGYLHTKARRVKANDPAEYGDVYLWIALDADTKAVLSFYVGKRDGFSAYEFVGDLSKRITSRFQLTTDGLEAYVPAVEEHFGADIDFAQLIKTYSTPQTSGPDWFRPSKIVSVRPQPVMGDPDLADVSTSYVERFNLSVRMHLRRFTRLTNAFSKSLTHLKAAVALFVAWYNFCRPHQSLHGVTPAMEAGLTDHVWSVAELVTT